ncbi:MAG TPA: hypothetical protein VN256_26360 [Pyrinomonadaceae bacterium]|nr:hypothetical protein [Pyrinomonadaceae bacterium]
MKLLPGCLALTLALAACGGGRDDNKASAGNTTTTQKTTETATTNTAASPLATATPSATTSPATAGGERPVEVTYAGVTPDKESIAYKIKVNTEKHVSQVDLNMRYMDERGGVVEETTYAWQNVVKSVRKPIEKGQTYEREDPLPEGAARAEVTLKRVIFKDGTRWEAGQ